MGTRRVFGIWSHPLFGEAVRRLVNHPDVQWVGATSDHAAALEQIAILQPDTIIIEEGEDSAVSAEALDILKASTSDVRVIRLSLADNQLIVYHRKQRTVGQGEDLLHLIRNS